MIPIHEGSRLVKDVEVRELWIATIFFFYESGVDSSDHRVQKIIRRQTVRYYELLF